MDGLHNPSSSEADSYLSQLLEEHQIFDPFVQHFPICSRLLNEEILNDTTPMASPNRISNVDKTLRWICLPPEKARQGGPSSSSSNLVKRILRLNLPVDKYPNVSFTKLSETQINSHQLISLLVLVYSTILRKTKKGKAGNEDINEQLHVLIVAHLPADIIDINIRQAQQLIQELVIVKGIFRLNK